MTAGLVSENARLWFGMVPKRERGKLVVIVDCGYDGCEHGERFTFRSPLPPDQVAKKAEQSGWRLRKGKAPLCSTHAYAGRPQPAAPTIPELDVAPAAVEGIMNDTLPSITLDMISSLSEGLNAGFYVITPETASAVLAERHRRNRNLRASKLVQLTQDIRAGSFMLNGESIIFDHEGHLIDGQHRLKGCADSGVAIMSLMAFGLREGAMGTVDQGAARSPSDVLSIDGVQNSTDVAAVARMVVAFEETDGSTITNASRISRAQVMDAVAIYPDIGDSASFATTHNATLRGLCPRSTIAFCHFILCQRYGKGQVENFLSRVAVGDDIRVGDPAFAVRKRLLGQARQTAMVGVEVILRDWLSQLRGKTMATVPVMGVFPDLISEKHRIASLKGGAAKAAGSAE